MLTTKECQVMFGSTKEEVEAQLVLMCVFGHNVKVHKKVAPLFSKAVMAVGDFNSDYQFDTVETYNWRFQRGYEKEQILSKHSFGIAVDINPKTNPQGFPMQSDIPMCLVIAISSARFKLGNITYWFVWGGFWNKPDPMHFEVCYRIEKGIQVPISYKERVI